MAIQYSGGTNINSTFISDGTKGNLQSNLITQLASAGWSQASGPAGGGLQSFSVTIASPGVVTLAGHGLIVGDVFTPYTSGALPTGLTSGTRYFVKTVLTSSTFTLSTSSGGAVINTSGSQSGAHTAIPCCRMISATTAWSVYTRLNLCDTGGNCLQFGLENMNQTILGSLGSGTTSQNGAFLLPVNLRVYRVIACKYQAFIFSATATPVRGFVCFGTPYLPPFLQGVLTDCGWLTCNANADTDTTTRTTFRNSLATYGAGTATPATHAISNSNLLDVGSGNGNTQGAPILVRSSGTNGAVATGVTGLHWHDASALMIEPLIAWASSSINGEPLIRGQLWDAAIVQDTFLGDTTSAFDSHNWFCLTENNTTDKASLLLVVP